MKSKVQSIEISYIVHATEDAEKIRNAVKKTFEIVEENEQIELEGHFGNKIGLERFHITGTRADETFERIITKIREEDKKRILSNLYLFLDEHSHLYLRFDKQAMVNGYLILSESDSIRIKVKPRLYLVGKSVESFYRGMIGEGS